jgi:outer membrane protein assembly factor BamA
VRRVLIFGCLVLSRIASAQAPPPPDPAKDPAPPAPPEPTPSQPTPPPEPSQPPVVTPPPAPVTHAVIDTALTPAELRHAAEVVCAAHDPKCDWVATFSSLEQRSIKRSLAARGVEIEPAPWGKVIDQVVVVNEDVFAEDNWLQFFNNFHITTRERRVREELTIQAGEVWDQDRVDESARRLHDPLYTSVVALVPLKSKVLGRVELLVVTRDIWSLRLNTQYTIQQGALTNLSFSLSENNFLGQRDVLAAAVVMDQGSLAIGPLFIDKDFLGKHLDLRIRVDDILTRKVGKVFDPTTMTFSPVPGDPQGLQDGGTLHSEGSDATVTLSRPLWSLATEWGAGTSFTWKNAIARSYRPVDVDSNGDGDPYELYTDPDSGLPTEFRYRTWSVNANAVRQWGTRYKHQVSFGYTLSSSKASLLPSFAGIDPAITAMFAADVFPRSEVISQPFVGYSFFEPRYRTVRNVSTYDLTEDVQLGPSASVTVAQGLAVLGGDHNFTRTSFAVGYILPWLRDGFVHPSASTSLRFQNGYASQTIDNNASAQIRAATPGFKYFRVVGQVGVNTRWHDTQNQFYAIGSDSGLRGYNINQFRSPRGESSRLVSGQFELRTTPVPVWVGEWPPEYLMHIGAVVFYEVGGAAASLNSMALFHDIGFGLRILFPQTSRELFRFDLAFPMQSAPNNPAWHPHFIAGFDSYF